MALTEIKYGSLASSEIMNHNFQYLDNRASELSNTISTNYASTSSNFASINSSLNTMQEKNTKDIKDLQDRIHIIKSYINGDSGYRIYSDNYCIQWGKIKNVKSNPTQITLLKEYKDANYQISFISEGDSIIAYTQGVQAITTQNFSLSSGAGTNEGVSYLPNNINIIWETKGYAKEGETENGI